MKIDVGLLLAKWYKAQVNTTGVLIDGFVPERVTKWTY